MAGDAIAREVKVTPFLEGLREGLDAALEAALFPDTFAPDFLNVTFDGGKFATRPGITVHTAMPGSGDVRLLAAHYEADGTRIRLLARGDTTAATLYDFVVGTDSAFAATSGGTGLGGATQPYFQMVTLDDTAYFLDRAGPMRKYQETPSSGNQVRPVALPARPSAAPGVKARTFEILEGWTGNSGVAPYGWTVADSAKFNLLDGSSAVTSPITGTVVELDTGTNPNNSPISENVSGESIPSAYIAMWVWNGNLPSQIVFRFGLTQPADFSVSMDTGFKETWAPIYVPVGGIGTINYKQFVVIENAGAADLYLSPIVLPGRLQGTYLYVYTHYDPTLGRESEPSDLSNSGTPLDLSALPVSGQSSTAAAFQKSAAVTFTSDSGTDSTTTKVRIYRNGGTAALTQDENGVQVWCRVGEVLDFSSQVDGATLAGATTMVIDSVTGLAVNDWLVIEKGTVSKEEYARITVINAGTRTLTFSQPLAYAHSDNVAVQMAYVDNVANDTVDRTATIDLERDDPPSAARFIVRTPDGRLAVANWTNKPTGIAISNRATPARPKDYEVMPDGVDPLTRGSLTQGWRFELGGDPTDEEITGLVVFHDRLYAFTRRNLYAINAGSQADWGPYAVTKALAVGCIAGDTVAEGDGWLYWAGPGPRVFRWDGQGQLQVISHERINVRLAAAPASEWAQWFARYHAGEGGGRYRLYFCPEEGEDAEAGDASVVEGFPEMLFWYSSDVIEEPA